MKERGSTRELKMALDSLTDGQFAHLDIAALEDLFERNKVRILRLLAEAAIVRADQAEIQAEIDRR